MSIANDFWVERLNRPANGYWFVPGGRISKNESLKQAFSRLTKEELDVELNFSDAKLLNAYDHFYGDNVFGDEFSTHYVAIAYKLVVDKSLFDNLPIDEQHAQYRWLSVSELLIDDSVHKHTKWYFEEALGA